jgi:hypothetical protein
MSSDIFSLKAIDNISESLNKWKQFVDDGLKKYQDNYENEPYIIGGRNVNVNISFLGYIYQQYVTKTTKEGVKRPVKAYENIIKQMNRTLSTKLEKLYTPSLSEDDLLIGEIPTLNSLIPLSQIAHKPIFNLTGSDGVVGAHFSKVKEYERVVKSISNKIKRNLNTYAMA